MSDALLFAACFLACWLAAGAAVAVLFSRARNRRPYLAARWDDEAGDWVNETPHDVGPDGLLLQQELAAHLKAYAAEIADLYEPVGTGDHTTTNPTGDQ